MTKTFTSIENFDLKKIGKELQKLEIVKAERLENSKELQQKAIALLQNDFADKFKGISTNRQEAINLWIALNYDLETNSALKRTLLKLAKTSDETSVIIKISNASNVYLREKNKKTLDFIKVLSSNLVTKTEVNNNLEKLGLHLTDVQIKALQNEFVRISMGKVDKANGKRALFKVLTTALQNANALPVTKVFNIDLSSLKQIILIDEEEISTDNGRPQYAGDKIQMFQKMQWLKPEKFDAIDLEDNNSVTKYINNCLNMCAILNENEQKAFATLIARVTEKEKGE